MKRTLIKSLEYIFSKKKAILFLSLFIFSIFLLWPITNAHSYYYSLSATAGNLTGGNKCSNITFSWTPTGDVDALAVRKNYEPTISESDWSYSIQGKDFTTWTSADEDSTYKAKIFNWDGVQRSNVISVKTEPCCTDHCSPSGEKQCTDNTHYMECGNYDADPCLEWSSTKSCPSGQTCSDGICSTPSPTGPVCGNGVCESGENSSNCPADCPPAGPVCGNGVCESGENSTNCPADCPPAPATCDTSYPLSQFRACFYTGTNPPNGTYLGAKIYSISNNQIGEDWGSGVIYGGRSDQISAIFRGKIFIPETALATDYKFTVETDDGVKLWVEETLLIDKWYDQVGTHTATKSLSYGSHSVKIHWYENGGGAKLVLKWEKVTVPSCTDDCSPSGTKRCVDNNTGYQTCGNYDTSDSCLEWSSTTACSSGQTCSGGTCSGGPSCTDECSPSGSRQCTDGTHYKTCGNYDTSDSCLEWSSASSCSSDQTCSEGICSSTPPEVILNVPLYSQGSYDNEYYVLESGQRKSAYAYNCGGSASLISNTGCYPTSAAMVLDYYGKNMGVVNTVNSCTDNSCHPINGNCGDPNRPYYSSGSNPYCSAVFEAAGLGSYFIWNEANGGDPFREEDLFQITDAIAAGFPVIVNVTNYYGFIHAMVVKGYRIDGQGNVTLYVNDPNGGLWQAISDPSVIQLGQVIYP